MDNKKILAVDCRINTKSCETLEKSGYKLLKIPLINSFDEPVAAHPDMCVLKLGKQLFVRDSVKELFTYYSEIEVTGETSGLEKLKYPYDVSLNCAVVGKRLICNEKHTDKKVLAFARELKYEIINVNQGYAKCSTCVVGDNGIITEDESIEQACRKSGIDELKIAKGHVRLNGYNYGFIGGCSGLIEDNLLAFNGNVFLHPDGEAIHAFCRKHGTEVLNLCDEPLYDVGSIVRL